MINAELTDPFEAAADAASSFCGCLRTKNKSASEPTMLDQFGRAPKTTGLAPRRSSLCPDSRRVVAQPQKRSDMPQAEVIKLFDHIVRAGKKRIG